VAALARRQHGVVSRAQLTELGIGDDAIDYRLGTGRLHSVFRCVYAVGHEALPPRGRDMAAVLTCGPNAVLSHRSAAALWGIRRTSRTWVDVSATRSREGQDGIDLHRIRSLQEQDRAVIDGIPVTGLARTYLDLAEVVPPRHVQRAMEEGDRLQIFDLRAVQDVCERSPGRHGVKTLRALMQDAEETPHTRQELERFFLDVCKQHGLPRPAVNAVVEGYEVDAVWRRQRLVVELDGWEFHRSRRSFERDRERDAVLQLAGYRVIRITYRRLTREPAEVAAIILRLLAGSPSTTRS
jgi:very-short-patch-repair endonuclease